MEHYDLCIIGGGPSGYAAAMRALDFEKKVCLIEKDKIGGAGLFNGAFSSKTLWEHSNRIAQIKEWSQTTGQAFDFDFGDVKANLDRALFERKFQLGCHLKLLETEAEKKLFRYERGLGKLISPHEVLIQKKNKSKTIYADHIILSTGSSPRKLAHIPVDEQTIVTSDGVELFDKLPESMVILGAGVIGCEYATIFSNLGKTKVFLIDKADRILPFEDEDIANLVASNLEANGVTIHRNSKLVRMDIVDGQVEYELAYHDGRQETHRVEKGLLSVGRIPNTQGIGLEAIGVEVLESGHVQDHQTQTNVPHIYAVGDIIRRMSLVNVGELEGRYAVERMFDQPHFELTYRNISTIMFLHPEVAGVGVNEQELQEKGQPYRIAKLDYSCIARAIAMRRTQGFFKILVSDEKEMRILGMRAVGEHASSAIQAVALLISMNKGVDELADLIHPHPSIIEGVQEALRMLRGDAIFKSSVFRDKLKCYRWENGEYHLLYSY